MAQTNFTPISLYYSATAAAVPTAGNLVAGELAINTADGKLFYKDSAGVVQTIASKDTNSGSFVNLAYTGTLTGGTGIVNLGSGQFYKDASGNIGIGTSSPATKTEINGTAAASNIALRITNTATDGYSTLQLGGSGDGGLFRNGSTQSAYGGANSLNLITVGAHPIGFATGNTLRAIIDSSGNLGIATASPNSKVTIGSNATDAVLSGTSNTQGLHLYHRAFGVSQIDSLVSSTSNSGMSLRTYNNGTYTEFIGNFQGNTTTFQTAGSERMRIDSSGNVGIGTSSPAMGLHVVKNWASGKATVGAQTVTSFASGGIAGFGCFDSDGSRALHLYSDNNAAYAINTKNTALVLGTNDTERMRITAGGDIGINNSSPANRLDVIGSTGADACQIKTTNSSTAINLILWNAVSSGDNVFTRFATDTTLTARGGITYNRAGGLVVYGTTSDYRAKDIIGSVLNSGEVIDSVPVYMGKMKGATQARPMFIAHETPDYAHTGEKDAVDKDGNPAYQQMDVSSLVPVLWAEVQSLRKRLALLESK